MTCCQSDRGRRFKYVHNKESTEKPILLSNPLFLLYFGSQIDDKEFDIPQVETPPTLESILNEVKYMLLFDYYTVL